jgi:hypothetical protein
MSFPHFSSKCLERISTKVYQTAVDHGFWEGKRNFGECLALIHSEVSEALEAWRDSSDSYFTEENGKPEGWGTELVDVIIRCLDTIKGFDPEFPIDLVLRNKMEFNRNRPLRHGRRI